MSDNKIKSQRGDQVDVFVKNRIKWPHEFVLAGSQKERVSYDQLTMGQWMAGFCRSMREEGSLWGMWEFLGRPQLTWVTPYQIYHLISA